MKRALLLGSSFSAAPIFFALKRRGLHVTVCGARADDPCHQYADSSAYVDYSQQDDVLAYVETQSFDYLVPSCNDFSYMSAAWVSDRLGFPGYDALETALTLHTKHRFRAFCAAHDIPAPRALFVGSPDEETSARLSLDYPAIVKPVDSFSGRGTTQVSAAMDLDAALAAAKTEARGGEVVVEEFVTGSLHSHSAFFESQSIVWDGFVDEYCTIYPYQVDCSHYPSALPDAVREQVRAVMTRLAAALRIADGLLHTQFIVSGSSIWIVECMRRCPGDLYPRLIQDATGVPYTDMFVAKFLGESLDGRVPAHREERFIGRHTISVADDLVGAGFTSRLRTKSLSFAPLKTSAERLGAAPFDKLGIAFIEFESGEEMRATAPDFAKWLTVDVLGGSE